MTWTNPCKALIVVVVASFAVLLCAGHRIESEAAPIPARVVETQGNVSIFMQGLDTTPVHGHAALLGVYVLGLALTRSCARGAPDQRWNERTLPTAITQPAE